eukprot:1181529-Prorocentrum_minimum.AAC.4
MDSQKAYNRTIDAPTVVEPSAAATIVARISRCASQCPRRIPPRSPASVTAKQNRITEECTKVDVDGGDPLVVQHPPAGHDGRLPRALLQRQHRRPIGPRHRQRDSQPDGNNNKLCPRVLHPKRGKAKDLVICCTKRERLGGLVHLPGID